MPTVPDDLHVLLFGPAGIAIEPAPMQFDGVFSTLARDVTYGFAVNLMPVFAGLDERTKKPCLAYAAPRGALAAGFRGRVVEVPRRQIPGRYHRLVPGRHRGDGPGLCDDERIRRVRDVSGVRQRGPSPLRHVTTATGEVRVFLSNREPLRNVRMKTDVQS